MFRIDHASAAPALPTPAPEGTPGYFTAGDPVHGEAATVFTADFANMLQEELMAVVEAAGIEPDKSAHNQLLESIRELIFGTTLGIAQAWEDVSSSRVSGTDYVNDTGRPIQVFLSFPDTGVTPSVSAQVNGIVLFNGTYDAGGSVSAMTASFVVPTTASYKVTWSAGTPTWCELR